MTKPDPGSAKPKLTDSPSTLTTAQLGSLKKLIDVHAISAVSRSSHVDPGTISRAVGGLRVRASSICAIVFWLDRQGKGRA